VPRYYYFDGPDTKAIAFGRGKDVQDVREDLVMAECSFIDYRLQNHGVVVLTLDNPLLNLNTFVTLDKLLSPAGTLRPTNGCVPSW